MAKRKRHKPLDKEQCDAQAAIGTKRQKQTQGKWQ